MTVPHYIGETTCAASSAGGTRLAASLAEAIKTGMSKVFNKAQ
jgi:hypothetical protein